MGALLAGLTGIQRIFGGVMVAALLLSGAWGWRMDTLRAEHLATIQDIGSALVGPDGKPVPAKRVPQEVRVVIAERNDLRIKLSTQNEAVLRWQTTASLAGQKGEEARRLLATTLASRNTWITTARTTETRTQRLPDNRELEECNAVLDSLYRDGF